MKLLVPYTSSTIPEAMVVFFTGTISHEVGIEPSMIPLLIMDACFSICCLGLRDLPALPSVSFDDTEPLPLSAAKTLNIQYYLTFLMDVSSIFGICFSRQYEV
ncbi:hypothetical protein OPV22_000844 [Ensete ventricosum]|uniref:Uncharacterized protein n=1 Tax=Ensete ventricosum TaxID=4639 RepID=A0AAV8QC09_ENSVE|nr:hypothetical protein OPV22_000844 [Ensete ventricosum]